MKNAYKYSLIAVSLAVLVLSCQKNPELTAPEGDSNPVTLTCAFPTIEDERGTKVTLGTDGKTAWEADVDAIVFQGHPDHSAIVHTFTSAELTNPEVATFDIDLSGLTPDKDVNQAYNAAYPASLWSPYSTNMFGRSSFSETNHMLMAGYVDGSSVILKHVTAAIVFKVSGDYDSYTFEGNNGEIVGYSKLLVEINKPNVASYRKKYLTSAPYGSAGPLDKISGSLVSDGTTLNTIFLPVNTKRSGEAPDYTYDNTNENGANVTYLPDGFTIKLLKGGVTKKYITSTAPLTIRPGHMINLGELPSAYLHDYVSAHTSSITPVPTDDADENLSKDASANCYVVNASVSGNAEKIFKFKAIKGNSSTVLSGIESVDIIWETYNNAETVTANSVIAAVDYDLGSGDPYIVFQMPATLHAGNALIAAKNGADEILWSWHIWVPSTSIANVNASNICGATMMDRNLGALEKVSTADGASVYTLGMLYQWGRKDPFPGGKRITEAWPNPATVSGTAPSVHAGSITMDYAIAHPTEFASNSGGDWQSTTDMTRWNKDAKTVNDPCPPGYKIPYGERGSKPLWNTSNIETAVTGAGMTWELSSTGYWFRIADGGNELVFPLAGYVEDGASSYGIGNTQTRAAIWCLSDSGSSKYHLNIRSGSTMAFGSTSAARGCSVRCVAE